MAQAPNTPSWQPLSGIPLMSEILEEGIKEAQELYETLSKARAKPHVLDDYTVDRVIDVYESKVMDEWMYAGQLKHWKELDPTHEQLLAMNQYGERFEVLKLSHRAVLKLAHELKGGTIDRILEKDPAELAIELLTGQRELPK